MCAYILYVTHSEKKKVFEMNLDSIREEAGVRRSKEIEKFRAYFQVIVDHLTQFPGSLLLFDSFDDEQRTNSNHSDCQEMKFDNNDDELTIIGDWTRRLLNYNLPFGKLNRGLSVVINFQILTNNNQNDGSIESSVWSVEHARLLGWCLEMFQSSFLIIDDIMDQSDTRRGQPCWYKVPDVGMVACNDAVLIETYLFCLIKEKLGHHPCYLQMVHLIQKAFRITASGQCLDVLTEKHWKNSNTTTIGDRFKHFNKNRLRMIYKLKTAYYTFVLPIRLALYLANITDSSLHEAIKSIMLMIGELFQIQDDYLDCYGQAEVMGKSSGTDIRDGKCTWLIVEALTLDQLVKNHDDSSIQTIMAKHYGQNDDESERRIKQLYDELKLDQHFQQTYRKVFGEILVKIGTFHNEHGHQVPVEIFYESLTQIFPRVK